MKRVLVTGCAGFIGSHLCERLLGDNYLVVGVDNLSKGRMENIAKFMGNDDFEFYRLNILTEGNMKCVFDENRFDTVFHLAANSDISVGDPQNDIDNTLNTTLVLLEQCQKHNVKEFIFASSGSIYGDVRFKVWEDYGACMPISHYAASKLASEAYISSYSAMYGIKSWICRLPNVVGERATHGIILDFIDRLKRSKASLKVLGNGEQRKTYMYVTDLIDAMIFIWTSAKQPMNYFNIAGQGHTLVREIAEMVVAKVDMGREIVYEEGERGWNGDVPYYDCDTTKLSSLGWKINRTSNDAIELAIEKIYEDFCGR